MANLITGLLGMIGVTIFMGIMLWWVPAPPLIIICLVVGTLMVIDFVSTLKFGNNGSKG